MALGLSKRICILTNKNSSLLSLGSEIQNFFPVAYSTDTPGSRAKLRTSLSNFLKRAEENNEFMKEQMNEFKLGKEFLAKMMGNKSKQMTQEEVDEAIEYLLPSALFVKGARPLMKPPEELFKSKITIDFDEEARPHHYLYYTMKPNFSECLHEAATHLERLNVLLYKKKPPPSSKAFIVGSWLTIDELSVKFKEKLFDYEYKKFLEVFNVLRDHPHVSEVEGFLKNYWKQAPESQERLIKPNVVTKDNVTVSTIER